MTSEAQQRVNEIKARKAKEANAPISPAQARVNEIKASKQPVEQQLASDPSLWEMGKEFVTGEKAKAALPKDIQDLPEFSERDIGNFDDIKTTASMLLTLNPEGQKEIIESLIPEASFKNTMTLGWLQCLMVKGR